MNEDKIPTAEEFLKIDNSFTDEDMESLKESLEVKNIMDISDISMTIIEFAKLHVKLALEAACDKLVLERGPGHGTIVLNAYPLENIK